MTPRRAGPEDVPALEALQHVAYAANRSLLGVEPLPLRADYSGMVGGREVWLFEGAAGLEGALVLEPHNDHLFIWSVATAPTAQGHGLGNRMLQFAETRACTLGLAEMRLYTGEKLATNIAWYRRRGYRIDGHEALPDRIVVHMSKSLETPRLGSENG